MKATNHIAFWSDKINMFWAFPLGYIRIELIQQLLKHLDEKDILNISHSRGLGAMLLKDTNSNPFNTTSYRVFFKWCLEFVTLRLAQTF
jgi:hypothetical protein